MPLVETVTILNKSGKVVSTGKHLVNIFKDAKEAYQEKKAELKNEHLARIAYKNEQKLMRAQEETRSVASSHRSHRSSRSHRPNDPSRPPLSEHNLTHVPEGSVASSHRSRSSHHGSRRARSPRAPSEYRPTFDEAVDFVHPGLQRRHTDLPVGPTHSLPPPYNSQLARVEPLRTQSNPDFHADDNIDMNLAYGRLPEDLQVGHVENSQREQELEQSLSKIDQLLLEAQCVHHTATSIISNLQANPEAMAAVALTLAELSNLLTKMSPNILTALKVSSPAVFALLASPQFLIAGGVALGVTVVMFGGYKIIKKIQEGTEVRREAPLMEAPLMETALEYDLEMGTIESWRRGIADVEERSVSTSVDGEFITPEAARRKKEHIRERRREERDHPRSVRAESVISESVRSERSERSERSQRSERSHRTVRRVTSESTLRSKKESPLRASTIQVAGSETGRSERSHRSSKGKELVVREKKEKKAGSTISSLFKKSKDKIKEKDRVSTLSHRPRIVEM